MAEFSEQVKATTQDALIPKVVDNVLGSQVLAYRAIGNGKKWKGELLRKPIKVRNSNSATSFAGLDTFNAAQLDTKIRLSYDVRGVRQPVALAGMDASVNGASDDTQIIELIVESLEETQQELVDYVGGLFYQTGTGNSNKDFLGAGALIDDGTDVTTIGGQSRTTFPVLNATRTASPVLSLTSLATLFSAVSSGTEMTKPTIMTSSEAVWDMYESLLTPTVREQYSMMGYYDMGLKGGPSRGAEGLKGTAGFVSLTYKGLGWVRDEKATTGNVFMHNERFNEWYGLKATPAMNYKPVSLGSTQIEGVYGEAGLSDFTGFNWSGWNVPTNQFGMVGEVNLLGNYVTWQPRRSGRLTGVAGV